MMRVIERATGIEMRAEEIEGGYQVFTMDGEKYKKLRESTFKKYFKAVADEQHKDEEVSTEKRDKMVEKIKKMMALAENNPSEEEALAAALQAHKLMVKYNIHESEVTLEEVKEDIVSVFSQQKHGCHLMAWRKQLAGVVATAFRCKAYVSGQDVVFRGYRDDAQLALDVYLMLYIVGNKLGCKAYDAQMEELGTGKGAYNSMTAGFLCGVRDAFNEQCTALMVITPKEVEEDWEVFSAGFGKGRRVNHKNIRSKFFNEGYAEGKQAVKSRAVEG